MSKLTSNVENYLWNCFKFYLMTRKTCLCDNFLNVVNSSSDDPMTRYNDFNNALNNHIGLGSYVAGQAAQFSRFPYLTVNINTLDGNNCNARVIMTFDIAFGVDTPDNRTGETGYPGNSSEAIAQFRANVLSALDEVMYNAFNDEEKHYSKQSFFDALRDTSWVNPITKVGEPKEWKYNVVGSVDDDNVVGDVFQLKKEDRSSACLVFSVSYTLDVNRLYGDGNDCGC